MGFKKELQVLLVGFGFATLALVAGNAFPDALNEENLAKISISGLCTVVFSLATLICADIWRLKPADSHTLYTLYCQYKSDLIIRLIKRPYHKWLIYKLTIDPKKATQDTLMQAIQRTKNTEYGQKYNFSKIKSREDFARMHPLTDYEYYREYIDRIINGESNVLFPGRPVFFAKTSGTSGDPKCYPIAGYFPKPYVYMYKDLFQSSFIHLFNLKRTMRFYLFTKLKYYQNVPVGGLSMMAPQVPIYNITPSLYTRLHHEEAIYYTQGLFSLAERELQHIFGFSSDLMYHYIKCLIQYRESLCTDIERGTVSTAVDMPEDIRQGLSKQLKPDPQRAEEIRKAFDKGNVGLVRRLWPHLNFITMSSSACFKMTADIIFTSFLKGIKTMPQAVSASEGLYGVNLDHGPGMGDVFTAGLYPTYIELIPVADADAEQPKTVFLEEAKLGEEYEMVVSGENGLFRFRTGDTIKIVGFLNKTPQYKLLPRQGVKLSAGYERLPEPYLYEAMRMTETVLPSGSQMMNFVAVESQVLEQIVDQPTAEDYKGHYIIFIGVNTEETVDVAKFAVELDINIKKIFGNYEFYRDSGQVGLPKVYQTSCDAFTKVKDILMGDRANGQFKFPRVLRKPEALKSIFDDAMDFLKTHQ